MKFISEHRSKIPSMQFNSVPIGSTFRDSSILRCDHAISSLVFPSFLTSSWYDSLANGFGRCDRYFEVAEPPLLPIMFNKIHVFLIIQLKLHDKLQDNLFLKQIINEYVENGSFLFIFSIN